MNLVPMSQIMWPCRVFDGNIYAHVMGHAKACEWYGGYLAGFSCGPIQSCEASGHQQKPTPHLDMHAV